MNTPVPAPDPTVANTDLWSAYLEAETRRWMPRAAEVSPPGDAASLLSDVMTALWGGFIAQLFQANAPEVTRFVEESHASAVAPNAAPLAAPPNAAPLIEAAGSLADVTPEDVSAEALLHEVPEYEMAGAFG